MYAEPARPCVYTCLMGGYEGLHEQPAQAASKIPFLCFTDGDLPETVGWKIIRIEPSFPADPVRSQRYFKIMAHRHLLDFDASLYIDNSVQLLQPPEMMFGSLLGNHAMALLHHSFRETVLDEFLEVSRLGLDDQARILEQMNHYLLHHPDILQQRPLSCGILLRRHHEEVVREAMEIWFGQVLRYSRRDQLSANLALRHLGSELRIIEADNNESDFHKWPVINRRVRGHLTPSHPVTSQLPPQALLQEAVNLARSRGRECETLRVQCEELKKRVTQSREEAFWAKTDADQARAEKSTIQAQCEELEAEIRRIRNSRGYRLLEPLRRIRAIFR